jgi:hypothetical protein
MILDSARTFEINWEEMAKTWERHANIATETLNE